MQSEIIIIDFGMGNLFSIKKKIDSLIVLAWNFFKEIKRENRHLSKQIINIKDLEK